MQVALTLAALVIDAQLIGTLVRALAHRLLRDGAESVGWLLVSGVLCLVPALAMLVLLKVLVERWRGDQRPYTLWEGRVTLAALIVGVLVGVTLSVLLLGEELCLLTGAMTAIGVLQGEHVGRRWAQRA